MQNKRVWPKILSLIQSNLGKALFALIFFALALSQSQAACHAVTPTGSGSETGADWNDAYAGIPSTLTRGDVYYFADGNYGSYTFSTPVSGTATIEFRKAQAYDYGRTSDGCSNDISAGWNASTMGSSQAVFSSTGKSLTTSSNYLIINGNGNQKLPWCGGTPGSTVTSEPSNPADCGFSFVGLGDNGAGTGGSTNIIDLGSASHITLEYFELIGSGNNNGDLEIFGPGSSYINILHSYERHSGCVFVQDIGSNTVIDHSYFWGTEVEGAPDGCHGQAEYIIGGQNNNVRSNNVYRDITGTAVWTFGTGGTKDSWQIYNNVVFFSSPQLSFGGLSDAALDCINGSLCTNITYVHNTIVNCLAHGVFGSSCGVGFADGASGGSVTVEDNLFYSNPGTIALTTNGTTVTEDYNTFLNSGSFGKGANDVVVSSGSPDPFVDWVTTSDFNLASENADWGNRLALNAPYSLDVNGNTFTTDRGAYEMRSATTALTGAVTSQ
ncbi:MAG TPA: hypothetical protein VME86_05975 [Acidobacteriaceae bacterium]|nr:hypothetical protein [Acidobacteriaceae bacterium]